MTESVEPLGDKAGRRKNRLDSAMTSPQNLLKLLHGKYSSLIINFNEDHAMNSVTADEWGDYNDPDFLDDWVSEAEHDKAISENSVWTIQWYPDTQSGFYIVRASTFEVAAKYALGVADVVDRGDYAFNGETETKQIDWKRVSCSLDQSVANIIDNINSAEETQDGPLLVLRAGILASLSEAILNGINGDNNV